MYSFLYNISYPSCAQCLRRKWWVIDSSPNSQTKSTPLVRSLANSRTNLWSFTVPGIAATMRVTISNTVTVDTNDNVDRVVLVSDLQT
mmetsp:Transcript_19291/g.28541  ORF Transcript_19291/g.28541 Transcript_19291/m.28541 type:complete len:88 (+) Transcript_19291:149-412(+)